MRADAHKKNIKVAPTRGRGLKLPHDGETNDRVHGRPHPGARIETLSAYARENHARRSPPPGGAD